MFARNLILTVMLGLFCGRAHALDNLGAFTHAAIQGGRNPQTAKSYSTLGTITPSAATLGLTMTAGSGVYVYVSGDADVAIEWAEQNSEAFYQPDITSLHPPCYRYLTLQAPYLRFKAYGGTYAGVRYLMGDLPSMTVAHPGSGGVSATSRAISLATYLNATSIAGVNANTDVVLGFGANGVGTLLACIAPSVTWPGNDAFNIRLSTTITGQIQQVRLSVPAGSGVWVSPTAGNALPLTVGSTVIP